MKHRQNIILLVLGFLFRLFLAFNAYDTIVFDAKGYSDFAVQFLRGGWPIDCCAKNMGYPAFLAAVYGLFGIENLPAVRLVHVLVDMGSALLVWKVAKKIFSPRAAYLSFLIYLFNPFTSAFTGLVLAETVSIFLLLLMLFFIVNKRWFLAGVVAGLLLFVRHSFYYFLPVFFGVIGGIRGIKGMGLLLFAGIGFVLASSYSLVINYKTFGKPSLVPLYNLKYEIIYLNFYRWKYPEVEFMGELPEYGQVVQSYWNTPLAGKAAHSEKYKQLLIARLPGEWPVFVSNLFQNVLWLWDKDHLYTYADRFYPADRWPMRILNIGLISLWGIGVIWEIGKKGRKILYEPVFVFSVLLFAYITALFPLLSNESRHTIIYYPLLSLWAGNGIQFLLSFPRKRESIFL
jgi:4-amino-4-deoxy-L-arabinose transferase-like glycosyltransferase